MQLVVKTCGHGPYILNGGGGAASKHGGHSSRLSHVKGCRASVLQHPQRSLIDVVQATNQPTDSFPSFTNYTASHENKNVNRVMWKTLFLSVLLILKSQAARI